MAKKRLTLRDKQGNVIDYDISAARVTIDAEGKSLEVKLSELVAAIAATTMRVVFNGDTHNVNGGTINLGNQLQPDWAETSTTYPSYIKNKPDVVTGIKVGASGTTITPTNGVVTIPESGGSVDVDNAMSASSDNPVANRVIKAYVDNLINGIINGAPAALDTLNELSAALGNDSNFAATITQQLALKANDASVVKSISVNGQNPQTPNNGNVNLVIEAGAQGPKGETGNVQVDGNGNVLIVNNLDEGGTGAALSAEMGKRLALMSGTFAQAWARSKAIPFPFCFLWNETIDGDAISKPIWHKGNSVFVDAAGAIVNVSASDAPDPPTITGATSGDSVPKNTQITITPASGSALYYSLDGGTTYNVSDAAVTIALTTAGSVSIVAYCANNAGNSSNATLSVTVAGTAVPTFAAKPNSGTTLTQKTGYIEVSRGGYVRISGTENGTLYYSTDGENYTEVQGNNYYDFQIANSSYETTAFVIYAKNKVGNDFSDPVTGTFKMAALDAPSFSPAAGTLPMGGDSVSIEHTDNNVNIFYTTDGSTPTDQSTQYDPLQPISVASSMTIKAIAKDNYGTSEVATAAYEVPVDHKFQFKIALTGGNSTEYIPVRASGGPQYTMTIDWGDGTTDSCTNKTYAAKGLSHSYTGTAGTEFTVTLRGSSIPALDFGKSSQFNTSALVAVLENSLECDTAFGDSGTPQFKNCANLTSISSDALSNNTNTKICFQGTGLTSIPDGLLSHLTKSNLSPTSLDSMFNGLSLVLTASQMAELSSVMASCTVLSSMFYGFKGTCAIPDDFFDNLAAGSVTSVSDMTHTAQSGLTGDAKKLYDVLVTKIASGATTTRCFNSRYLDNYDQVPSSWGGTAT